MKIKDEPSHYPKHNIFSIKYKEEQPTFFWPYLNKVNSAGQKSWRFEYNVMLDIFDNMLHNVADDEYVGIKLSHPAGWEVIFVEIVRDEVNGSYAALAVDIEDFKKYSRIISSPFRILTAE
jgi:hypothetical protein